MSRKSTRRPFTEDSFSSIGSGHTRSTMYPTHSENSFLSDDRSGSSLSRRSQKSAASLLTESGEENVFIVDDSEASSDDSFHSAHDSPSEFNSPKPPPRKQPTRFAKMELDKPKSTTSWSDHDFHTAPDTKPEQTPRKKALADDPEARKVFLELYPEYVNEFDQQPTDELMPSPVRPKPKEVCRLLEPMATPINSRKEPRRRMAEMTPLKQALMDPEDRALFLEFYPERADELASDDAESGDDHEPIPIVELSSDEETAEDDTASRSVSRCSGTSNDSFENYLKVLKGEKKTDLNQNEETDDDEDFVVSDTESIVDEEAEDEDESYEDEDESGEEKENSPVYTKPKSKVVNSLLSSFASPSLKTRQINVDDHFLASLSADYTGARHPDAIKFAKNGIKMKKMREELTDRIFEILKRVCFEGEISMEREHVVWNPRLRTTAGQCKNNITRGTSKIELSTKVCTTPERLRDTLVHEMCHAATFLIDAQVRAKHGPWWQKWTRRCLQRCPSLPPIGVCHAYEIDKKFIYECNGCSQKIGRHSKSFNTEKFVCGRCKGRFVLTKNGKPVTGEQQQKMNPFAEFVKANYSLHTRNGMKHDEVMKILSAKWRESKRSGKDEPRQEVAELDIDISILSIHD